MLIPYPKKPNDDTVGQDGRVIPHPTDSTDEEFNKWADSAYLGDASSVNNLLVQCYEQLRQVKDGYIQLMTSKTEDDEEYIEAKERLSTEVYPMLQRIENRVTRLRGRIAHLMKHGL